MKNLYKKYLITLCLISLSILSTNINAQHFNFEGGNPSDPFWTLYIAEATLNSFDLVAGDEIAIFDGDLMVGAISLTQVCTPDNQFENVLLAFNTLSSGNPGYTPGNPVLFKCWDASLGIEISEFEISFDNPYGDAWTQSIFPFDGEEYSLIHLFFDWIQLGNLSGIIINAASSQPIEGALVTIEGTSYNATSSSYGNYLIEDIEIGTYSVNITAEGYFPETINGVVIITDETTLLIITMNIIPGIISGIVINSETMEALAGATIVVEGTTYTTTTNANGEYIIEEVEPDTYCISASAEDFFPETISNQTVVSDQTTIVDFALEPIIKIQTYNLGTGFQFVSSRLIIENPDIQYLLEGILDNLNYVRNSEGYMLRKIGPNWVNNIGDWVTTEGYLFKMNNEDSFEISGEEIYQFTPIELTEGYQIISYLPSEPLNCEEVFLNILNNLIYVRNGIGNMLRKIGPFWINNIGDMQPDEAYLIKMIADDVLVYVPPFTNCGDTLIDPRDGQFYNTIQIGNQCWIAENLNIGEMISGLSCNNQTNNDIIEKYCYDDVLANCEIYGGLYQWNEMMEYATTEGVQGICPAGWHLPSDDEWKILEGTVDSQYPVGDPEWNNTEWRGYDAGLNLKSTSGWYEGNNGSGLYDFEALPGGELYYTGSTSYFYGRTTAALFWTSSNYLSSAASWKRYLHYGGEDIYRSYNGINCGYSVRCLKDETRSNSSEDSSIQSTIHFAEKDGNPLEPVWTIYFEKGTLNAGDEIAVFYGEKLAGSGVVASDNVYENAIPVFSNLYETGNKPIIKVWDKREKNEYVLSDYTFSNPYGDAWTEDVFPVEDGEYSLLHFSTTGISDGNEMNQAISIYPNPSTGIITIGNLSGFQNLTGLEITDITGKRVFQSKIINHQSKMEIDLSMLEKRIYFICLSGKNINQVKKIVIQ
ncbi:MAG: carboxypeptidase regulatory-like domain-containing protein [Bacteroidales bacterium]|nr:carboxypeptidase regulatory-like domain-containing protein [Bacteroidales bacterium]